jgi:redox-regulated HSP33 family molecular chaperone
LIESTRGGFLRKALSRDKNILVVAVDAREVVEELLLRQQLMPPSLIHVGQAALGALLLQALTDPEENQRVEFQWKAQGPFGNLYAEALGTGKVRATIGHPQAEVDRLDEPLGEGILQVRRFTPPSNAYSGIVSSSGKVGTDLVEYLERSEQKSCGVSLSVQVGYRESQDPPALEGSPSGRIQSPFYVKRALGFLVHVLPQPSEAAHLQLMASWDRFLSDLGPLSQWVLTDGTPEESTKAIVDMLLPPHGSSTPIYAGQTLFSCNCSEDRALRALALAREAERSDGEKARAKGETPAPSVAVELPDGSIEVTCEFCGTSYRLKPGTVDILGGSGAAN